MAKDIVVYVIEDVWLVEESVKISVIVRGG